MFGDEEEWNLEKSDVVDVNYTGNNANPINLGNVEVIPGQYMGKAYTGYNDPLQINMAKEMLTLYKEVAQKQEKLIQKGYTVEQVVGVILGKQISETNTYTYKTPIGTVNFSSDSVGITENAKQTNTLIPFTMVAWNEYGRTVNNKTMNFRNYTWEDFAKKNGEDNPSNLNPGTQSSSNYRYYSGFNYKGLRSYTGAVGPFQFQPTSWGGTNSKNYLKGEVNSTPTASSPQWVSDVSGFTTASTNGNGKDFNQDGKNDLYNLGDDALAVLEWFNNSITGADYGTYTDDVGVLQVWFAYEYRMGSGNVAKLYKYKDVFNSTISSIIHDDSIYEQLLTIYDSGKGGGLVDENNLFKAAFEKQGWKIVDGYFEKDGCSFSIDVGCYLLRNYFAGKCWYTFLQGVAYGGSVQTGDTARNHITYNYMTASNSKRNTSDSVRKSAIDNRMAIGYKGNIPIYDQTGSFMKDYTMLNYSGTYESFYEVACTVFTMTSAHYATGNNLPPTHGSDLDVNTGTNGQKGYVDPVEFWGIGRQYAGTGLKAYTPQQLYKAKGLGEIRTVSIRNILSGAGYKINNVSQGTTKGNESILDQLKQGIPVHIRVLGGRKVKAFVPNKAQKDIDYATFDLRNLNNYDTSKYVSLSVAGVNADHSVLGVDAIEINNDWYIGVVNTVQHHTSGWDTNIVWFLASDLLQDKYPNSYSIVGSVDPTWKPVYLGGESASVGENYTFKGTEQSVVLDNLNDVLLGLENSSTMTLKSDLDEQFITVTGNYKTEKVNNSTLRLYTGESNDTKYVLEFTGIYEPQTNSGSGNKETTSLFKVKTGTVARIKSLVIDSNGDLTYESFYDETNN